MANRYIVAGGTWDASNTAIWSATSGGASGASVPTAADDVFLDAASGAVTVTTTQTISVCRSLTCTGFTGTLSLPNLSGALLIGDASGGAMTLSAGMTLSFSGSACQIQFGATSTNSGAGWPITTAGKTVPDMLFATAGGKWTLQDTLTATGRIITLTAGTLDTNNQTITAGVFSSSNSSVRTLTLGSSTITLTSTGTAWSFATTTNLIMTANTATVTCNGATATFNSTSTFNTNGLSVVMSGSGAQTVIAGTLLNLTRTGTAAKTDGLNFNSNVTVTNTLTLNSNSSINRLLVQSNTPGTPRTITAANAVITSIVDFMDITGAGSATWTVAGTGATALGDCGGNGGITFTTPVTQTHTASAGGNWSDVTKWSSRVPLPQDNVVVDINTTGTLTAEMPRMGANIDFTGFAATFTANGTPSLFGNLTWSSGMSAGSGNIIILAGRSTHTVTSNGKSIGHPLTFQGPGGTYTLQDALSTSGAVSVNDGTWTTNNQAVTCTTFTAQSARNTVLNLGSSTINLTATSGSVWLTNTGSTTLNAGTSTVVISTVSTSTRIVNLGSNGQVMNALTYTVANSPGALQISNSVVTRTITTLNVGSGRQVIPFAGSTLNVTNWNANGANSGYLYLPAVSSNFVSAPDSVALSVTGDIDLQVKAALTLWVPAADSTLIGKWGAAGQRSYQLRIDNTGKVVLVWSVDGTAALTASSTVSTGVTDGSVKWIRGTMDVDNGSSQRVVKFYTSDDGSVWTQLGTTVTTAGATSIFDSTAAVEIGSLTTGTVNLTTGNFYRAITVNGYDGAGTVQLDADFTTHNAGSSNWSNAAKTTFTESSSNAATVTINGSLAQVGDGRVAITSSTPGSAATLSKSSGIVSSSYLSIQDSTATGGASWHALSSINVSNNSGWIFSTPPSTNGNFTLFGGPN